MVKKLLRLLVPTVSLSFLFLNIVRDWQSILVYKDQLSFMPLMLSFLVLLTVYPEGAYGWYLILKKNNLNVRPYQAVRVWIIANTARYIPGKVWQYVGRVEMAHNIGINRTKTISSLLLEVFLVLIAGLFVSVLAFPFIGFDNFGFSYWVLLFIIPLVLSHPSISNLGIELIAKFTKRQIKKFDLTLDFKDTLRILPWFILNFFLNGLALSFLISASGGSVGLIEFIMYAGFYSVSWVLGFISLVSPGGIGVADVSLAYLLSLASMPLTLASAVALVYRFLLTGAEALVFVFVIKFKKMTK